MKQAIKLTLSITAFWLIMGQPAVAGTIQCGVHYIQDAERLPSTKYEVLKKCGEPVAKMGNIWVYEQTGGLKKEIVFTDAGTVASIRE